MIQPERVRPLNELDIREGDYVLYWMQQSQRARYNHALEYAIEQANDLEKPVLVAFGLMDDYPEANLRHYAFMLEGLQETQATLEKRGIKMVVQKGNPADVALKLGGRASLIVCDRGYLRHQKAWREKVAKSAQCRVVQIESDVIVPVETASDKAEYAARTFRPKIHRHLERFLVKPRRFKLEKTSLKLRVQSLDLSDLPATMKKLKVDGGVAPVDAYFRGGTSVAKERLRRFIKDRFDNYQENRNRPHTDNVSHMSPYLHFGQISSLYIALQIQKSKAGKENKDSYLDELIVRRELTMNFVCFTPNYDSFSCLPDWAKATLKTHKRDRREHVYTRRQLEDASTHDEYWNAAMKELLITGYMHNYMRMYWGKKILEWSRTPEAAFRTTLAIMNKYFLDGRDGNAYANTAWLYGLHDRGWPERPVFGKVRYMSAGGLKRKANPEAYVERIRQLTGESDFRLT